MLEFLDDLLSHHLQGLTFQKQLGAANSLFPPSLNLGNGLLLSVCDSMQLSIH